MIANWCGFYFGYQLFRERNSTEIRALQAESQALRHEEDFAARNGIRSVPTFVVNGKYILQGSSEPENFKQALVKLASMEAMA